MEKPGPIGEGWTEEGGTVPVDSPQAGQRDMAGFEGDEQVGAGPVLFLAESVLRIGIIRVLVRQIGAAPDRGAGLQMERGMVAQIESAAEMDTGWNHDRAAPGPRASIQGALDSPCVLGRSIARCAETSNILSRHEGLF
jgi:hypothetical protein